MSTDNPPVPLNTDPEPQDNQQSVAAVLDELAETVCHGPCHHGQECACWEACYGSVRPSEASGNVTDLTAALGRLTDRRGVTEPNRNPPTEVEKAVGGLIARTLDAQDEVDTLTPLELADRLATGRWTTLEVHRAAEVIRELATGRRGE